MSGVHCLLGLFMDYTDVVVEQFYFICLCHSYYSVLNLGFICINDYVLIVQTTAEILLYLFIVNVCG